MNPSTSLCIAGELTIYRAAELHGDIKTLLASAAEGHDVAVDLSAVTEMDSAGLQLLVAARKSALATRRALKFVDPSPAVVEVLEFLQLAVHFNDVLHVAR